METRFNNGYTRLTSEGVTFAIGDYVSAGRTKGTIIGIDGIEGEFLLESGRIISHENCKQAINPDRVEPPKPVIIDVKPVTKKVAKVSTANARVVEIDPYANERANAIITRLKNDLDECNAARKLPHVVTNAPTTIQASLPEVRTASIMQNIQIATTALVDAVQSENRIEAKAAEKVIQQSVDELKAVAAQSTISATTGCRVQISKVSGRDTIRVYFVDKPDKATTSEIGKQGFRAYSEIVNGRKEWYWGAFANDKRLQFAKDFCKDDSTTIIDDKKEYAPYSPIVKRSESEILNKNEDRLIGMYHKYGVQSVKYGITPRFPSYELFAAGLLHEYESEAPKKLYPDFVEWAREWVDEYPEWIDKNQDETSSAETEIPPVPIDIPKSLPEQKKTEIPPRTISTMQKQKILVHPQSNKIVLSPVLKEMMPLHQQAYLRELDREGVQELQPVINNIESQIADITHRQDGEQSIVKAHYFYGGNDWYATEYEGDGILYGYAILNNDYEYSEWGRFSINEFNSVGRVEMDFYWTPQAIDAVLYKKSPDDYPKPESMNNDSSQPTEKLPELGLQPAAQSERDKQSSAVLNSIKEAFEKIAATATARAAANS
ncbi:MAG: hypothetical protein IPM69_14955 [Ignavibacteria bacterium]|nr:hypothetical protein [Ignavibacteria bacterium]